MNPRRFAVVLLLCCVAVSAAAESTLHDRAVTVLRDALRTETEWVRVHAAEALIWHGYPEGVEAVYRPQTETAPQHRIGVWRVLAQAADSDAEREQWVARIRDALVDVDGPDRLHAAETLGKLADSRRPAELQRVAREGEGGLQACARWVLAGSGDAEDEAAFAALLGPDHKDVHGIVGYGLRWLDRIRPATWKVLVDVARACPQESEARVHLLAAGFVHAPNDADRAAFRKQLLPFAGTGDKGQKYQTCAALGLAGTKDDIPLLTRMLDDPETDVRVSAAEALLRLESRLGEL
jgi:HEAT repeat protein